MSLPIFPWNYVTFELTATWPLTCSVETLPTGYMSGVTERRPVWGVCGTWCLRHLWKYSIARMLGSSARKIGQSKWVGCINSWAKMFSEEIWRWTKSKVRNLALWNLNGQECYNTPIFSVSVSSGYTALLWLPWNKLPEFKFQPCHFVAFG